MTEFGDKKKMYYFVDESGDPNFLGRGKTNLLEKGLASKYFMVGYLEMPDPLELHRRFQAIRDEVAADDFLNVIPSVKHSGSIGQGKRAFPEKVEKRKSWKHQNIHATTKPNRRVASR